MSLKFSIMDTINFDRLDSAIDNYVIQNGSYPYIFMSEDTASAIENDIEKQFGFNPSDSNSNIKLKNGTKALYCGYKVFINNDLKLGTVEIR